MVPLSALTTFESRNGPEFTMRFNEYRAAQLNGGAAPGYQHLSGHEGARRDLRADHAGADGLRLFRHLLPGEEGAGGSLFVGHLRILAALRVSDPGGSL